MSSGQIEFAYRYDPSTLYIPDGFFKKNKITDGQQQWWEFKAQHFDSVLMFKMGKFYEVREIVSEFLFAVFASIFVLSVLLFTGKNAHLYTN